MKILITGASGFIGKKLCERLILTMGHEIHALSRDEERFKDTVDLPIKAFRWSPENGHIDEAAFVGIDAIIHLAGESVADGKWNKSKKERILSSRIKSTETLIKYIKSQKTQHNIKKFISSSAVGIYGNRKDEELSINSSLGSDFLASTCKQWEKIILTSSLPDIQTSCLRTGIVLGQGGGALSKMLPPFKLGLGGPLGDGKQYMSWIHINDLVNMYIHILEKEAIEPIYNGVSPNPLTNKEFTKTLGKVLKRPTLIPAPSFALRLALGEMADMLLGGQRVTPTNFKNIGFTFEFPQLENALRDIFLLDSQKEKALSQYQWIGKKKEDIFDFFSSEKNLELITPDFLNFKVLKKSTTEIQAGTLIDYKLKIKGFPVKWRTEIEVFEKNIKFIDNQLHGPYKKWHHTHNFYDISFNEQEGTLIHDYIVYKVPFGIIGRSLLGNYIRKDIEKIFNYRRRKINEMFNENTN